MLPPYILDRESRNLDHLLLISSPRVRRRLCAKGRSGSPREPAGGLLLGCCRSAADLLLGKSKNRGFPPQIATVCGSFAADAAKHRRRARVSAAFTPLQSSASSKTSNGGEGADPIAAMA